MSDSVRPHRRQPTRLPRPWDSPGKNTGVSCHFLLQRMKVKSESEAAQSCPTLRRTYGRRSLAGCSPWDFPGKSTGVGCHCLLRKRRHHALKEYLTSYEKYIIGTGPRLLLQPSVLNTFIHKFTSFIPKFLILQYIHIGNFELNITLPPRGDHWDLGLKKFLMMALRASLPACCLCSGINSPHGARGKEPACQCRGWKRHGFDPCIEKVPWRRAWQATLVFVTGESHGQRSLVGYSP